MGKFALFSESEGLIDVVLLRSKGDIVEAASIAQRLDTVTLESFGLSLEVLVGECRLKEGHLAESEFNLKKALRSEIGKEEAQCLLSRFHFQLKEYQTAIDDLIDIRFDEVKSKLIALVDGKDFKIKKKSGKLDKMTLTSALKLAYSIGLVIEAACIKIKSHMALGKETEVMDVPKLISDAIFSTVSESSASQPWFEGQLLNSISEFVHLMPDFYKISDDLQSQISLYRNTLHFSSVLKLSTTQQKETRKDLALYLLFGLDKKYPWKHEDKSVGIEEEENEHENMEDGEKREAWISIENADEAIDLLMEAQTPGKWEAEISRPLCYILKLKSRHDELIRLYENLVPGQLPRWLICCQMAKSYLAKGDHATAIQLLRKVLQHAEKPKDIQSLMLASKICAHHSELAWEGAEHARSILEQSEHMSLSPKVKGTALHALGICLFVHSQNHLSDSERTKLELEAETNLLQALEWEPHDPHLLYDLALMQSMNCKIPEAITHVRKCLSLNNHLGYHPWILLALLLTAEKRFKDADDVCSIALGENLGSEKDAEGFVLLLRTKAKIQWSLSHASSALELYQKILKFIRAKAINQDLVKAQPSWNDMELIAWHDVADLYIHLKQWRDAETCISEAKSLNPFSAKTYYLSGTVEEKKGNKHKALMEYQNSLSLDPQFAESKIKMGILFMEAGETTFPIARNHFKGSILDQPRNASAWHHLGLLYKAQGLWEEAADCFRVALMFENCTPLLPPSILPFSL